MATDDFVSPTPHILAVDSDQAVLGLYQDLLTEEGYRVTTQAYIDGDLTEIERLAPDLIILDYMLPQDDAGWSLVRRLQMSPATEAIPLILCTGAVRGVKSLSEHLDLMEIRVILKPFDIDQLLDVITEVLEAASPHASVVRSNGMVRQSTGHLAPPENLPGQCIPPIIVRNHVQLQ